MIREWTRKVAWLGGFVALLGAKLVMAQGGGVPITLPNPLSANDFTTVVGQVINFLYLVAVPLTAIMALVGGFQMITSSGNPEQFSKGRKTLMYAVIGFAVVIISGGVVSIIKNILGS
jgi:hypothetical protein